MDLVSLDNLTLELNDSGRAVVDREWSHVNRGREPWVRLQVVEKGSGSVTFNDQRYEMVPGAILCVPPVTDHEYRCDDSMTVHSVTFRSDLVGGISLFSVLDMPYELPCPRPRGFFRAIARLRQLRGAGTPADKMETWHLLLQIQLPFIRAAKGLADHEFARQYERFRPVLSLIEARLSSAPSVKEMASLLGLNPVYFSGLFAKVFGAPPSRYVLERRIQVSKALLSSTQDTIDQIGRTLGFVDGYHFSKTFKKVCGLPPSEYRAAKGPF